MMSVDARAISEASALLRAGRLVAFPTETVYGLGACAADPTAIESVFVAKGRPADNPLIVHGADVSALERYAVFDERARRLAARFWPGPLTLVLPAHADVSPLITAGLPTVAVRIPDHPVALALLVAAGALVAPSANRSGRPSPTTAAHVRADLGPRVSMVLDGGPCRVGIESTVLDVSRPTPMILRPGIISATEIERVLEVPLASVRYDDEVAPRAPGMKYRHYAPSIPVRLVIAVTPPSADPHTFVLTTRAHVAAFDTAVVAELTEATLYRELRRAERGDVTSVLVYAAPDELSAGLLDRVRRAANGGPT